MRLRTNWDRLNGPDRIAGVDLARGLAIVGMFAAHLLVTAEAVVWSDPQTWTALVHGRSSILFATLAGVSIGLVTGAGTPLVGRRTDVARWRLALRAAMLFVLGILLILTGVPVYVILPAYAILFLLAIPFTAMPHRTVLWAAGALALIMPFIQPLLNALPLWHGAIGAEVDAFIGWHYPFTIWSAFVLAGLGIARAGITRIGVQVRMLVAGVLLAVVGYGLAQLPAPAADGYWWSVWSAKPHSSGLLEVVGSGGFVIAVLSVCLLMCRLGALKAVTLPLRATGAMPLTAYAAQLVVWAAVASVALGDASDLTGFRELEPFWTFTLATLVGCTAWALLLGRGPLEWVLDRAAKRVVSPAPAAASLEA